jgi:hypothetical protein
LGGTSTLVFCHGHRIPFDMITTMVDVVNLLKKHFTQANGFTFKSLPLKEWQGFVFSSLGE